MKRYLPFVIVAILAGCAPFQEGATRLPPEQSDPLTLFLVGLLAGLIGATLARGRRQ